MDHKGRTFQKFLKAGKRADIRGQKFEHDDIIGKPDGYRFESDKGRLFTALKPTLVDYVPKMPRYATVIYPKDLAVVMLWADIQPGLRCLEAGIGSGGLATTVLRILGPEGRLYSYDIRQEAVNRGIKNIEAYLGPRDNHEVKIADVYAGIDETELDRILLDVPEPWQVVPHAERALADGGIFFAYTPTTLQMHQVHLALERSRFFVGVESLESLFRPWHIARNSVRPEQQMVGHTGFLTFARKVAPTPFHQSKAEAAEDALPDEDAEGAEALEAPSPEAESTEDVS